MRNTSVCITGCDHRRRSTGSFSGTFSFSKTTFGRSRQVPSLRKQRALAHVAAQPGCSLTDLFQSTDGQLTRDDIYTLDRYRRHLCRSALRRSARTGEGDGLAGEAAERAFFGFIASLRTGTTLDWDGRAWTVLNAGSQRGSSTGRRMGRSPIFRQTYLLKAVQQSRIRMVGNGRWWPPLRFSNELLVASEADLEQATRRFHIVSKALRKEPHEFVPDRTLRRWIAAYRAGIEQHGNGYMGLLPKPNHGNPGSKLSERARSLMQEFIVSDYESLKQKTMYAAWSALKLACDRERDSRSKL